MSVTSAQNMQSTLNAVTSAQDGQQNERKLKKACQDFEALFITHLLKTMRTASDTETGLFGKGLGGDLFQDLFDGEVAQSMASQRGIGLASQLFLKLKERGLLPDLDGQNSGSAFQRIQAYDSAVQEAGRQYDVEPALIYAVIDRESSGNPHAVSPMGAKGLMQLMDGTAREMGVSNSFDPVMNIQGGVKYLRQLLDRFQGDLSLTLAAYNAGPNAVDRFQGIPPFKETQTYVRRVTASLENYRQRLGQGNDQVLV